MAWQGPLPPSFSPPPSQGLGHLVHWYCVMGSTWGSRGWCLQGKSFLRTFRQRPLPTSLEVGLVGGGQLDLSPASVPEGACCQNQSSGLEEAIKDPVP